MNRYALIVEPDPVLASSFAAFVREEGHTPVIVRDGAHATAAFFDRGAPALLVTELSLPRIDGFDIVEKLRRHPSGARTPVVVVSASRELREAAMLYRERLGISAVLARAASEESVRRVIKRLLGGGSAEAPAPEKKAPTTRPPRAAAEGDRPPEGDAMEESGLRLRGHLRTLTTAANEATRRMARGRP